ncbi:MAG: DUF4430 domain-containing protein [Planctomycetota bacterium]
MADPEQGPDDATPQSGKPWLLPALLSGVLVLILALRSVFGLWPIDAGPAGQSADLPQDSKGSVSLTIDFGEGRRDEIPGVPWSEGQTVVDAMKLARLAGQPLEFQYISSGETGFLTSIGGVENEGVGGRNWQYEVNGERAQVSFCVQPLQPGDGVLWTLAPQP